MESKIMEKTEMMLKFEKETGKQSAIVRFMAGGQALEQKSYPKLGPYDYSMDYIAWLESKAKINYEAVETFQEIIRNQCDEITALKEKANAYDRLMSGGKKTLKEMANFLGEIVVVHKDGSASWHEILPNKNEQWGIWVVRSYKDNHGDIPKDLILFDGDWKDSLTLPDGWEEK